jgi:hypothetical protein
MKRMILVLTLVWAALCVGKVTITTEDGQVVELNKRDETDDLIEGILARYEQTVSDLIQRLKEPNLANMAKVKIVYALGELRALQARKILVKNINLMPERGAPAIDIAIARWGQYPAREALVKIGGYASRTIMDIIGSQKFAQPSVDGYAAVLAEIEGPSYAVMKLKDRMRQAKETAAKQQYQMVIDRVEAIRKPQRAGKQTKQTGADQGEEPGARALAEGGLPPIVFLLIGVAIGAGAATLIMLGKKKAAGPTK